MKAFTVLVIILGVAMPYRRLSAAPNHSIGSVAATPNPLPVNASTNVTLSVQISDPSLIANSINLLQLGSPGTQPTIVGQLQSTGNNRYTIKVPLSKSTPGQVQFQVSAAFKGVLQRVLSPVLPILFVAAPTSGNFVLDLGPASHGGPLSFNNFGNAFIQGGVIPPNGATIDVTSIPLPPPPLSNYIDAIELEGSTINSTTTLVVSNVSCTEVAYTDNYTATLTYANEAVYCPFGSVLMKFYLSYRSGDPNASQYLSSFQQFVMNTPF
jgi:hypothetical protein